MNSGSGNRPLEVAGSTPGWSTFMSSLTTALGLRTPGKLFTCASVITKQYNLILTVTEGGSCCAAGKVPLASQRVTEGCCWVYECCLRDYCRDTETSFNIIAHIECGTAYILCVTKSFQILIFKLIIGAPLSTSDCSRLNFWRRILAKRLYNAKFDLIISENASWQPWYLD